MPQGRVIAQQLPTSPGFDSRFTIKHNPAQPGNPWWVYYKLSKSDPGTPATAAHTRLVEVVNDIKEQLGGQSGGAFSINEHGQVIARMAAPAGYRGAAAHAIGVEGGNVFSYSVPIIFGTGSRALDPTAEPQVGSVWAGPLCGMSYRFAAPGNPKPPSRNEDEIWREVEGEVQQLSAQARITPYPPGSGPMRAFLDTLRQYLPNGGRFRVNEQGRAFTSDQSIYLGRIPRRLWFPPLTPRT